MSLLPAYFGSRKRDKDDLVTPADEPEDAEARRDIFDLIPARAANRPEPVKTDIQPAIKADIRPEFKADIKAKDLDLESAPAERPPAKPIGKNKHPVDMTDLSRLSVDTDGQLYWDGKPVKSRREVAMSRGQIVAAALITLFIVIGALGAAIQGTAAAHDWACKLGWATSYCAQPAAAPRKSPPRAEIPA